ncbi:hypothetical protein ACFQ0M_49415 [Kitasatospora aburaviensis]
MGVVVGVDGDAVGVGDVLEVLGGVVVEAFGEGVVEEGAAVVGGGGGVGWRVVWAQGSRGAVGVRRMWAWAWRVPSGLGGSMVMRRWVWGMSWWVRRVSVRWVLVRVWGWPRVVWAVVRMAAR